MPDFTPTQGRYLAYIHAYTAVHGFPPAEAEIAAAMCVSPPSVSQMVKTLEKKGLIVPAGSASNDPGPGPGRGNSAMEQPKAGDDSESVSQDDRQPCDDPDDPAGESLRPCGLFDRRSTQRKVRQ